MGETLSTRSIWRGQFSHMGSQRLLLLFRKDAHNFMVTRPTCTTAARPNQCHHPGGPVLHTAGSNEDTKQLFTTNQPAALLQSR